jgi:hypothetical protein
MSGEELKVTRIGKEGVACLPSKSATGWWPPGEAPLKHLPCTLGRPELIAMALRSMGPSLLFWGGLGPQQEKGMCKYPGTSERGSFPWGPRQGPGHAPGEAEGAREGARASVHPVGFGYPRRAAGRLCLGRIPRMHSVQ